MPNTVQTSIITLTLVEFIAPSRDNKPNKCTIKNGVRFAEHNDTGIPWAAWVNGNKLDHFERFPTDFEIHYTKTLQENADPTGEKRKDQDHEIRIELLEKKVSEMWGKLMVDEKPIEPLPDIKLTITEPPEKPKYRKPKKKGKR